MERSDFQKNAFLEYEANAWFSRNKAVLSNYKKEDDKVISLLQSYSVKPANVLEVGCSAGYRLDGIKNVFPQANVFGVEPSLSAIEFGRSHYKAVNFTHGTVDDMSVYENNQFDMVIVGFVFYVVDRNILLKAMAEIDRVLQDKGHLVIIDFFTETTIKKKYHHIEDFSAYTYKQKYDELFSSTQLYHLIDRSCYNHVSLQTDAGVPFQDLFSVSLLKKDLYAAYQ
jgi:ubiquinone/menaquinone biosynthesis C-methylase UbiE